MGFNEPPPSSTSSSSDTVIVRHLPECDRFFLVAHYEKTTVHWTLSNRPQPSAICSDLADCLIFSRDKSRWAWSPEPAAEFPLGEDFRYRLETKFPLNPEAGTQKGSLAICEAYLDAASRIARCNRTLLEAVRYDERQRSNLVVDDLTLTSQELLVFGHRLLVERELGLIDESVIVEFLLARYGLSQGPVNEPTAPSIFAECPFICLYHPERKQILLRINRRDGNVWVNLQDDKNLISIQRNSPVQVEWIINDSWRLASFEEIIGALLMVESFQVLPDFDDNLKIPSIPAMADTTDSHFTVVEADHLGPVMAPLPLWHSEDWRSFLQIGRESALSQLSTTARECWLSTQYTLAPLVDPRDFVNLCAVNLRRPEEQELARRFATHWIRAVDTHERYLIECEAELNGIKLCRPLLERLQGIRTEGNQSPIELLSQCRVIYLKDTSQRIRRITVDNVYQIDQYRLPSIGEMLNKNVCDFDFPAFDLDDEQNFYFR